MTDDLDTLTALPRFPRDYHKRIRHTNLIEGTSASPRGRVKVIGRLPGDRNCQSLVRAVLDRASCSFRGVAQTPAKRPTAPPVAPRPAQAPSP